MSPSLLRSSELFRLLPIAIMAPYEQSLLRTVDARSH